MLGHGDHHAHRLHHLAARKVGQCPLHRRDHFLHTQKVANGSFVQVQPHVSPLPAFLTGHRSPAHMMPPAELGRLPNHTFSDSLKAGLWPFTLHSKPHRLTVPRTPAALLPCRFSPSTRKKSPPVPTIAYAPMPKHRRRSD